MRKEHRYYDENDYRLDDRTITGLCNLIRIKTKDFDSDDYIIILDAIRRHGGNVAKALVDRLTNC